MMQIKAHEKFQSVSPTHASSRSVLKVEGVGALESPGGCAGPHPCVSGSVDLGQSQESVFLKSSQVMQMLIV